jgi:septum site-determining protein MinC
MSSPTPGKPAFDLKSTAWTLPALRLQTVDMVAVGAALESRFGAGGSPFDGDPVVIDLTLLRSAGKSPDFARLLDHLRAFGMAPVAVQGGSPEQTAVARAAGLVEAMDAGPGPSGALHDVLTTASPAADGPAPASPSQAELEFARTPAIEAAPPPASAPSPAIGPLVVDRPLRSGQRVYARGSDLIVLDVVSFGAEVIADGNIHVYAPLRGRAMAGARGNTSARIYTTCLEAQLVSVAGIYRTNETPLPASVLGRAAQVRLEGERLLLEPLGT